MLYYGIIQARCNMTNYQTKNKPYRSWTAYGLLVVFCIPFLAAGGLYTFRHYFTFGQVCAGHLYTPPVDAQTLDFYQKTDLGKWQLIFLSPAECGTVCQTRKQNLEAIHISLGKERSRVERRVLPLPHTTLLSLEQGGMIIIDPKGWLVIHYPMDSNPKGILKDLRLLLRLSRVG